MPTVPDWPMAHFGTADTPLPPVTADFDDPDPDDEELDVTPPGVVMMLGFDPKDVDWSEYMDEPPKP